MKNPFQLSALNLKNTAKRTPLSEGEKIALLGVIMLLAVFSAGFFALDFSAQSTPSGITAPNPLEGFDKCNTGFIGACNDPDQYVSGPESVLESWIFSEAIPWWVSFFLVLGAGVAVLMLMVGGVMVTVGAESEVRKRGVKTITWALAGLAIALFAFFIVGLLENLPLPGSTGPAPPTS